MGRQAGGVLKDGSKVPVDYYARAKKFRKLALKNAEKYNGAPLRISINNGVIGTLEVSKSDIKTIVSKNTDDNKFNAWKNELALDIVSCIKKSKYIGSALPKSGKHPEAEYFVYYERKKNVKAIICLRKMKSTGIFKPYAIINEKMFQHDIDLVK